MTLELAREDARPFADQSPASAGECSFEGNSWLTAGFVGLCVLSLLPFLLIASPPVIDFPNHVARLSLACSAGDAVVAGMYRYRLGLIPNLAVDLVNLPLCGILGPAAVLKGLTAASLALIYFSVWLIQRKLFGRPNAFALLVPALAFNLVTTMGYVNFLVGVAIACLMVALSIGREKKFGELLLIGNVGGLALFFCHIFALAFAMVFWFGLMLRGRPFTVRDISAAGVRTAALFLLPLMLLPFVAGGEQALSVTYVGKPRILVAATIAQYPESMTVGLALLVAVYLLLRNRFAEVQASLRLPLIALASYVVLVPSGTAHAIDIDSRTVVPLAYLFFAALRPSNREREVSAIVAGLAVALQGIALVATVAVWRPFSQQVDEFRAALGVLPTGAAVMSVKDEQREQRTRFPLGYTHLASYATLDRRIFNPLEFTGVGMQPLSPTEAFAAIDPPTGMPVSVELARMLENPSPDEEKAARKTRSREVLIRWPERFRYVVFYHFGGPSNFEPSRLTELHRGSFFSILKVSQPQPVKLDDTSR